MTVYLEVHTIRDSLRVRRSEWGLAIILALGWGYLPLLSPGNSFAGPSLGWLREWATETQWAMLCLLIGSTRVAVLVINGAWRRCSHARMVTAGLSSFVWATIFLNIFYAGTFSPGLVTYAVMLVMDMHTIYEAGQDARYADEKIHARGT